MQQELSLALTIVTNLEMLVYEIPSSVWDEKPSLSATLAQQNQKRNPQKSNKIVLITNNLKQNAYNQDPHTL